MNSRILKALSDIRSRQIVLTKFNPSTSHFYPNSYAYAIAYSVYPIFHEDKLLETDSDAIFERLPYYDTYDIPETVVTELLEYLDAKWLAKENVTFYKLEEEYRHNWQGNSMRSDLIRCLRYAYLDGRFDDEFWKMILTPMQYPVEAYSIIREFDPNELRSY